MPQPILRSSIWAWSLRPTCRDTVSRSMDEQSLMLTFSNTLVKVAVGFWWSRS